MSTILLGYVLGLLLGLPAGAALMYVFLYYNERLVPKKKLEDKEELEDDFSGRRMRQGR